MKKRGIGNNEVGVVIPYYHSNLKISESISLEQCIKVLGNYPIIFVVPDDMREEDYPMFSDAIFQKVPKEWLMSIESYNRMMLRESFYRLFKKYTYILIYQLDAFVFSDRLMEMCQYGYDYIGAPWLSGYFSYINANRCIWRVGNGGFSLRKVESIIKLLKKGIANNYKVNEDILFAKSDSLEFKVAPVDIALKFSFETEVRRCFKLNGERLPFGCHAWEKYDYSFWKPLIEKCGYDIKPITVYGGNEDEKSYDKYIAQRKIAFFWENIFNNGWLKRELLKSFSKQVDDYIIWGAGRYGGKLCRIFNDSHISIKCFIDNNNDLIGKKKCGYEIKDINKITISQYDAIIIAIKDKCEEVGEQLKRYGYIRGVDYIMLYDMKNVINMLEICDY